MAEVEATQGLRTSKCDIAIIGGGPSGSTLGCLLRKYNPSLEVVIFEREKFPREHVGESLLPPTSLILDEMGCWDKVEAANFPIKLGATYRWGKTPQLWDFDFVPVSEFRDEPRPAKFGGIRKATSFQVDRAIYDQILLDHAESLGCVVRQETKVTKIISEGDSIQALELETGERVEATHYVDASGNSGILRRAMNIQCAYHPSLQNIAIWDYWQNAEWAVNIGVGGTRIQIRSLPYGWIWFIPLGPTRTSIGLVIPVEYYKSCGLKPAELYYKAVQEEPELQSLLKNAKSEEKLETTKDWSFLAERSTGDNWYLLGECAGFADPILSAGVTMAQTAAKQLAHTINEIEHGGDAKWLKSEFESRQAQRVKTHIRFGDFWYSSNSQFEQLQEFTQVLARSSGLELSPQKAWAWIAQGGFIDEDLGIGIGGFGLDAIKESRHFLSDLEYRSPLEDFNDFKLNLSGTVIKNRASYLDGRVYKTKSFVRGDRVLPVRGAFELLINILKRESKLPRIVEELGFLAAQRQNDSDFLNNVLTQVVPALEGMVSDGWVTASHDPRFPLANLDKRFCGFHPNQDNLVGSKK